MGPMSVEKVEVRSDLHSAICSVQLVEIRVI